MNLKNKKFVLKSLISCRYGSSCYLLVGSQSLLLLCQKESHRKSRGSFIFKALEGLQSAHSKVIWNVEDPVEHDKDFKQLKDRLCTEPNTQILK